MARLFTSSLAAVALGCLLATAHAADDSAFSPARKANGVASQLPLPPPPIPVGPAGAGLLPAIPPMPGVSGGLAQSRAAPTKPATPSVFMSASDLAAARKPCGISRVGKTGDESVGASGGTITVRYRLEGGRSCLAGAATDADWAQIDQATGDSVNVEVSANTSSAPRNTEVTVAAKSGDRLSVVIHQAR